MITETNNVNQFENLTSTSRAVRVAISTTLMVAVLTASASTVGLAILSFLSIYLVTTAIIAWDPVSALINLTQAREERLRAEHLIHGQTV